MRTALYPGSFDPFHLGHLSVVEQLAALADRVVVAAVGNPAKPGLLTLEQRAGLIARAVGHLANVQAVHYDGLVVDLARAVRADVIARAVGKEAVNELVMAATNQALSGIRTALVAPSASTAAIGSRHIRELILAGRPELAASMVPAAVLEALLAHRQGARPS